ncbi:transposase [Streptomyces noursei ATCC 11455]|uniref:transposase n=1 Tax=Streptomyces noursei TaxID=1971 RepID=UPI00081C5AAB|nr:transposase [Streptomyces noursei ATCC 11455]
MVGKRQKYDPEMREGAVRIVLETGKPAAEVARDLGIHEATLQNWVSKARAAQESGDGPLGESEREELIRLRANAKEQAKRIVELEMEREVLKRCMVLWVK